MSRQQLISLFIPTSVTAINENFIELYNAVRAADLLTAIKTVDGTGSGLDADLLDGLNSSDFWLNSAGGWLGVGAACTYVSATSFTVAGDVTSLIEKGNPIKWYQTTWRYGNVASISYSAGTGLTTITLIANNDFSVANAAITTPYYSKINNPHGFPASFNWSPSYGALGAMTFTGVTTTRAKFSINGPRCSISLEAVGTTGGTASDTITFTGPVTPAYTNTRGMAGVWDSIAISGQAVMRTGNINYVRKYDASNLDLGLNKYIYVDCDYWF